MHFFVKISIASPYFVVIDENLLNQCPTLPLFSNIVYPNYSNIKDLPPFTPLNAFPLKF